MPSVSAYFTPCQSHWANYEGLNTTAKSFALGVGPGIGIGSRRGGAGPEEEIKQVNSIRDQELLVIVDVGGIEAIELPAQEEIARDRQFGHEGGVLIDGFDAVVDGRAARVASPIAQEAVNQNNGAQARRANRRFAG
mgnify:CR=1 FL=1